jgi:hypothetical protein
VGQCGTQGSDYSYVMDSAGVDVASYHDYGSDSSPVPTDLATTLSAAAASGKPLIVGEVGIEAQNDLAGCTSYATRATEMSAKMSAQFAAGISGFLPWDSVPSNPGGGNTCSYDIGPGDPLIADIAAW